MLQYQVIVGYVRKKSKRLKNVLDVAAALDPPLMLSVLDLTFYFAIS